MSRKTLIFIPTFDERENVSPMAEQLLALKLGADIVFMDDNSPDGTGAIVERLAQAHPVRCLHRPGKMGLSSGVIDGWKVALYPTTSHARVELDLQTIYLPTKPLTIAKVRQLLAHEIEVHAFRSNAGRHSVLALLSSGTQHSMVTDEGLAIWYEAEVERQSSNSCACHRSWPK